MLVRVLGLDGLGDRKLAVDDEIHSESRVTFLTTLDVPLAFFLSAFAFFVDIDASSKLLALHVKEYLGDLVGAEIREYSVVLDLFDNFLFLPTLSLANYRQVVVSRQSR